MFLGLVFGEGIVADATSSPEDPYHSVWNEGGEKNSIGSDA